MHRMGLRGSLQPAEECPLNGTSFKQSSRVMASLSFRWIAYLDTQRLSDSLPSQNARA